MQPILIHCGEFVTERLIEILDNLGIASHVTYSCCRTKSWPGSNAKASVTLKLHRQHSHRHVSLASASHRQRCLAVKLPDRPVVVFAEFMASPLRDLAALAQRRRSSADRFCSILYSENAGGEAG